MIVTVILACFALTASSVPLTPGTAQPAQGEALQPQGAPQFFLPPQYQQWPPQGGVPLMIPFHSHFQEPQSQQPMIFPHGYYPMFPMQDSNQLYSPYSWPMVFPPPPPNNPANQPPAIPAATPGQTPSGPVPSPNAPQPTQQNPQIVYMVRPAMNPALGGLSSEEIEMAVRMGGAGFYPFLPGVQTNMPPEAFNPMSPVGQPNPGMPVLPAPGLPPTGASPNGVPPTEGTNPGGAAGTNQPAPGANDVPAGQDTAPVQAPVQPGLQTNQPGTVQPTASPPANFFP
ncbi:uncharacterized protein ACJ7VT_018851 [Polymixia lowei]